MLLCVVNFSSCSCIFSNRSVSATGDVCPNMVIVCAWHFDGCISVCVPIFTTRVTFVSGCTNERAAAAVLGYTRFSWDNFSGKEPQPSSADKYWSGLTDKEKAAARVLGYTGKIWDNESGVEPQPASVDKHWAELTSCGGFVCIIFLAPQYL